MSRNCLFWALHTMSSTKSSSKIPLNLSKVFWQEIASRFGLLNLLPPQITPTDSSHYAGIIFPFQTNVLSNCAIEIAPEWQTNVCAPVTSLFSQLGVRKKSTVSTFKDLENTLCFLLPLPFNFNFFLTRDCFYHLNWIFFHPTDEVSCLCIAEYPAAPQSFPTRNHSHT